MKMWDDLTDSLSKKVEEPNFCGYQLIGDSQFLRFSESLIGLKRKEKNGVFHLGFCVSGQTISELLRRVQNCFADVSEKVVLMIGTNDLLRDTSFETMRDSFNQLLTLLCKSANKIILLTIPPVPKLKDNEDHWCRLKKYNDFIRGCEDDELVFVGDAYAEFIVPKTPRTKFSRSRSNSPNHSKSSNSTPISTTRKANGDRGRRRIISSNQSSDDELSPPLKKPRTPRPLPPDPQSAIVQRTNHRRLSSGDPKNFDEARQLRIGRRSCPPNLYSCATRMFGVFVQYLRKPKSENACSSTTSRVTPPSARKFNSHSTPPSPAFDGDRSRKPLTPAKTPKSRVSPTVPSAGYGDSFRSPSRERVSPVGNRNSYRPPRSPSSGEDLLTSRMGRLNTFERNYNVDGLPTPPALVHDSPTTPSRRRRAQENFNLCPRAEGNHNDSYGQGSAADDVSIENADSIREEYFEEYFCGDYRRPDLIHLNTRGLCCINRIIQDVIDRIEGRFYSPFYLKNVKAQGNNHKTNAK